MRSNIGILVLAALPALAQFGQPQNLAHRIDLPRDSPVSLVGDEWDGSASVVRGGAYAMDVRMALSLRNNSVHRRIRGITLSVLAQEAAPGGKGSISVPSLDVAPGETFSVRGDLHLIRPVSDGLGPLVEVTLDGILFEDLSFYGPDRLHSRRTMLVWELESKRDRQFLKAVLEQKGAEGLKKELQASVERDTNKPQFGVQVVRGRSSNQESSRELPVAFLNVPESPLEPMGGAARISGNEAQAPKLVVHNRSLRAVRYFEIGWVMKDPQGREFLAASMPSEMRLPPRSSSQILEEAALRFDPRTSVDSMTGFISTVEFTDGTFWIPSRAALADPLLRSVVTASPEEQRLMQIFRKRGVNAVMDELKRF